VFNQVEVQPEQFRGILGALREHLREQDEPKALYHPAFKRGRIGVALEGINVAGQVRGERIDHHRTVVIGQAPEQDSRDHVTIPSADSAHSDPVSSCEPVHDLKEQGFVHVYNGNRQSDEVSNLYGRLPRK